MLNQNILLYYITQLFFNECTLCWFAESGDLGGGQTGVHSERREGQPWLETLDRRRQTLPGGFTVSVMIIRFIVKDLNQDMGNVLD